MLCYSTGSLPDGCTPDQIAEILLPSPFRGIEYVVTPHDLTTSEDGGRWKALRVSWEARGFRVRNVHLGHPHLLGPEPHQPGFAAREPAARKLRWEAAGAAARIATGLGAPHLTVTTGILDANEDAGWQEGLVEQGLKWLIGRKPSGLKILIEQEPEHVIHRADQLLRLCRSFPGEVFANFDVGHSAVIGENIPAAVKALGPYLRNVHLEDIGGRVHRHLLFGEGDIDFGAVFTALRGIGYSGDLTPDLYPFKDKAKLALAASRDFLERHGVMGG
jgi:sugar phosphate isomerase/epimerase